MMGRFMCLFMGHLKRPLMCLLIVVLIIGLIVVLIVVLMGVIYTFYN